LDLLASRCRFSPPPLENHNCYGSPFFFSLTKHSGDVDSLKQPSKQSTFKQSRSAPSARESTLNQQTSTGAISVFVDVAVLQQFRISKGYTFKHFLHACAYERCRDVRMCMNCNPDSQPPSSCLLLRILFLTSEYLCSYFTITLRFTLLCSCCVFQTTIFASFSSTLTA
jgi:hypothetical protein